MLFDYFRHKSCSRFALTECLLDYTTAYGTSLDFPLPPIDCSENTADSIGTLMPFDLDASLLTMKTRRAGTCGRLIDARCVLGEYISPGPRDATVTIDRLLALLNRDDFIHGSTG